MQKLLKTNLFNNFSFLGEAAEVLDGDHWGAGAVEDQPDQTTSYSIFLGEAAEVLEGDHWGAGTVEDQPDQAAGGEGEAD